MQIVLSLSRLERGGGKSGHRREA